MNALELGVIKIGEEFTRSVSIPVQLQRILDGIRTPIFLDQSSACLRITSVSGVLQTVTTVTTVATVTNVAQIGATAANSMVFDTMLTAWANTVRRAI